MMNYNGTLTGKVEKAGVVPKDELVFKSRFDFPSIGKNDILYIATDENAIYYFNHGHYVCCGRDCNDIKAIQCII